MVCILWNFSLISPLLFLLKVTHFCQVFNVSILIILCIVVIMTCRISHFQDNRSFQLYPLVSFLVDSYAGNEIYKKKYIYEIVNVYIINSITKSYILNINIRPLVTEYAWKSKLMDGTSSAHLFNPHAYFDHLWSYFDIQNLRLVILYILV